MGRLSRILSAIKLRPARRWSDVSSTGVLDASVREQLEEVLSLTTIGQQRRYVNRFEKEFAAYHGIEHAIGMNSGTTALFYALKALGVGENDEVITVANTWASTITAVQETGARCRFAEVNIHTGGLDPAKLEGLITPRTRVVLPVHMYGIPADMPAIMEIARRHNLFVIEDACQAIGACIDGKPVGTWGDMGCFSFHTNKLVGAPADGGMIVTASAQFAGLVRDVSEVNWSTVLERSWPRIPSRLPALAVPVLRAKLTALQQTTNELQAQYDRYKRELAGLSETWLLDAPAGGQAAHRNCVMVSENDTKVRGALTHAGWAAGPMYEGSVRLLEQLDRRGVRLPQSEYLLRHHVLLPIGPKVSLDNQDSLIKTLREIFARPQPQQTHSTQDKAVSSSKACP